MTVAVAVSKGGRTFLAADSLVHFGGQKFLDANCRFHKIHAVGNSMMAWAGWSLYAEMLTAHLARSDRAPLLKSESEVFDFFLRFWRAMRDDYTFMYRRAEAEGHPFVDLDSVFLLVNAAGIFRVASDMDVTQFNQYCAIGSGSKYALGALRVLYDQNLSAEEVARRAVQVGIDCDVYCGGTIDIEEAPSPTNPV
jgi:ATP-dependent HslUV protease subunit HslV